MQVIDIIKTEKNICMMKLWLYIYDLCLAKCKKREREKKCSFTAHIRKTIKNIVSNIFFPP